MNLLARAKLSAHLIFASPSLRKRYCYLQPITVLQQCNNYATRTSDTSLKKGQQPKTQKSSEPSWSYSQQRTKKQTEALDTVWPKPKGIPYQAKVSNFVNLIGHIKIPVQFESDSDGKHFATTVISLDGRDSLSIPVVFEGDLAHVVACHVKKNDCVFVSGELSVDHTRFVLSESLGKFHIVAENLNFVRGFEKSGLDGKIGLSFSDMAIRKPEAKNTDEERLEKAWLKPEAKNTDEERLEKAWLKASSKNIDEEKLEKVFLKPESKNIDEEKLEKLVLKVESAPESATVEHGNVGLWEKGNNKIGESVSKKKDMDQILDLWRDLVKNPMLWWDYRGHKNMGLVKERFPDFKQKATGEALWINTAPKWVMHGIEKLEFDVKDLKPKQVQGGENERNQNSKADDSWKNLVENPHKWWDNRTMKKNLKAPDFRHKETGEVLWLNKSPVWVLSRLPPVSGGENTA